MPRFNARGLGSRLLRPLMLDKGKFCREFPGAAKTELAYVELTSNVSMSSNTSLAVLATPPIWFDGQTAFKAEMYFSNFIDGNWTDIYFRYEGGGYYNKANIAYTTISLAAPIFQFGILPLGFHSFDVLLTTHGGTCGITSHTIDATYAPSFLRITAECGDYNSAV